MSQIKVTKVDTTTNLWEYVDEKRNATWKFRIANKFEPKPFDDVIGYLKRVISSDLKLAEKIVLSFLSIHNCYGTTTSPYLSSSIAKHTNLSYKTVRGTLNSLIKIGALVSAPVMTVGGNLGNQYQINEKYQFKTEKEEEAMYYDCGDAIYM